MYQNLYPTPSGQDIAFLIGFYGVYLIFIVQLFFSYGTAYRLTKSHGDNGASLFGWFIVVGLASMVPGLGFYLWSKYRKEKMQDYSGAQQLPVNSLYQVSPGWYPDPSGNLSKLRFWDGAMWSDHYANIYESEQAGAPVGQLLP
ncbi:MAG: DUF2510 domain-containing protein [Eggerthellaceae bacterium]|nr:DUF2510 domain-containing protein [Eggerthellaceae bacterium]